MKNYDKDDTNQHFFAACAVGWAADTCLVRCIDRLREEFIDEFDETRGMYVIICHVPCSLHTGYEINLFIPVVKGTSLVFEGKVYKNRK